MAKKRKRSELPPVPVVIKDRSGKIANTLSILNALAGLGFAAYAFKKERDSRR